MDKLGMLPVYLDSEFTGLHRNTTLISIGLLSQSGYYFYAEFTDYDKSQVTDWIRDNVVDKLILNDKNGYVSVSENMHYSITVMGSTEVIRDKLLTWLRNESTLSGKKIQIYSDCYAYDWVLFNSLICDNGEALNIPDFIYYIPVDLSTALQVANVDPDITREDFVYPISTEEIRRIGLFSDPSVELKHNCLFDAYIQMLCFEKLGYK